MQSMYANGLIAWDEEHVRIGRAIAVRHAIAPFAPGIA